MATRSCCNKYNWSRHPHRYCKNGEYRDSRVEAVRKITDQNILAEFAKNGKNNYTRENTTYRLGKVAVENITNQDILVDIVENGKEDDIKKAAVENITNQDILVDIAKNEENNWRGYKEAAVNKITDQSILAEFAKKTTVKWLRNAAVKNITEQNILFDIAKNGKYIEPRLHALNKLNKHESDKQIIELINQNKYTNHNLAALAALRIIPKDKILKNSYEVLEIHFKIDYATQLYIPGGTWVRFLYDIEVKTNKFIKSFHFEGKKGGETESIKDIESTHLGFININKICEILLSSISKEDLLKISKESDIYYLRETAKSLLKN